jgi:histidinol-phosphate aminotransferase
MAAIPASPVPAGGNPPPPPSPEYFDPDPTLLRLDNNTNPLAHPVVGRIGALARTAELNRYGSVFGGRLRSELARYHALDESNLIVGNGSDEMLDTAARAFLGPGRCGAMVRPGYEIYASLIARQGARLLALPLRPDLSLPTLEPVGERPALLYLASPHNPTGRLLSEEELVAASRYVTGAVVVDEAYGEYASSELWETGRRLRNVLFTRTFSKAWGLAGLRVGYALGPPDLVRHLHRFQIPFTLGTLPEAAAVAALGSPAFLRRSVERVRAERPRLAAELVRRGFRVFPSEANFLFTYPPVDGEGLWEALRRSGVLVRRTGPTSDCRCPLRVTVGTRADTRRLLAALDAILPRLAHRPTARASGPVRGRRVPT